MTQTIVTRLRGPVDAAVHSARALVVAAAMLLILAAGDIQARDVTPTERVTSAVVVRAEPSTDAAIGGRLRPRESATLIGEVAGWYEVETADGTRGWVSKRWTRAGDGEFLAARLSASGYKVHVIDVGTGLAVFVEGKDFALLYDAGSQDDLHDGDDNRVVSYIEAVRPGLTRLDHLILSHPHKDHLELMPAVFAKYSIANIWDSGRVNKTNGYCHFLKSVAAEPGVRYHDAIASNTTRTVTFIGSGCKGTVTVRQAAAMSETAVPLGAGAAMTILNRDPKAYSDANGNSVVVRLDLGARRVLLAGDAEGGERELPATPPDDKSIEGKLVKCCAADLRSDVLIVGHHGSLTSSRTAFLDAVSASIYAISSGPYPYHRVRLPDDEIVTELERRGQVLRTDKDDLFRLDDEARACEFNEHKTGPDADENPGGCNNIVVAISATGTVTAAYSTLAD